ncbi:EAL and HDOD domain-containing protein [Pilimelia columellifera]|uniref:HDOD domain-containing protein n=1 Tax=Pilimelia columellifera subsp. columellifera TaxID=706583 RepID=A0ABN3NLW4_9ACTN
MTDTVTAAAVLLHRQPVHNESRQLVGYEIRLAPCGAEPLAEAGVAARVLTDPRLGDLGGRRGFVTLPPSMLADPDAMPAGPGLVVMATAAGMDETATRNVLALAAAGRPVGLTGATVNADPRLLDVASYLTLDLAADPDSLRDLADECRLGSRRGRITLIAGGVATGAHLTYAKLLGCGLLEGPLLSRPEPKAGGALSASRLGRVQLMAALQRRDTSLDEIVAMVARDPALSFRLLNATNSASSGLSRRVSSVREAVVLLGTGRVRQWVSMMAFADMADANEAYLTLAVSRARMCQLVAERLHAPGEAAFTAGLLLAVAELTGSPIADVVDRLPLAAALATALVSGAGQLGEVLGAVRAYERWLPPAMGWPLPVGELTEAYLAAGAWSARVLADVLSQPGAPARSA